MVIVLGAALVAAGGTALGVAAASQYHAPQPRAAQAGSLGPPGPPAPSAGAPRSASSLAPATVQASLDRLAEALASRRRGASGLVLARSRPVALEIPKIAVNTAVGEVGLTPDGTIQVPPLFAKPSEAAWYRYSPTPGQVGPSVIVGHVDNVYGPAVFFRLGSLAPGDHIKVTLADGTVATFVVDGVRRYPKANFPTAAVYGPTIYPALRLITCGGPFDYSTRHYLDSTVVFASLASAKPA